MTVPTVFFILNFALIKRRCVFKQKWHALEGREIRQK